MTPVTNALSSKEASPNEKGQISSINTWQSYGSSYNKWMKKGLFVARKRDEKEKPSPQQQVDEKERSSSLPFAAAWKRDEKEKPVHQYVACSPQQVDEKWLFFRLLLLGKRDEKGMKKN
jgi:hypothetical protein